MKKLLVVLAVILLASPALAEQVRKGDGGLAEFSVSDEITYSCDSGLQDNGLYQDNLTVYGNAFDVGDGGQLMVVEFSHYAWMELYGPYDYNIYVYDEDTCSVLCLIGPLQAADAYSNHVIETVDVSGYGCFVSGSVVVGIQALSMSDYGYYHPTLDFENTPGPLCMRRVDIASATGCDTPWYDYGDFLLRITVGEATPAQTMTFGSVKTQY